MSRWLVTRPAADAEALARTLAELGHEAVVAPVMTIVPVTDPAIDLEGVQALAFTSANGVRAFATAEGRRDLPVLAVGDATAAAARDAGFAQVEAAEGTGEDLARLIRERISPGNGLILHGGGRHLAVDLEQVLAESGFGVRRVVLYEAEAVDRLPEPAREALATGGADGVLLFSPRSADLFVRLVDQAGLGQSLTGLTALCLSPAVARKLAAERWREIFVAERPERDSLLAPLRQSTPNQPAGNLPADSRTRPERAMAADDTPQHTPTDQDPPAMAPEPTAAERVIAIFGGIRPMAGKLDVPVTTVQGWKKRGAIPEPRHADILAAAEANGIALDPALLAAAAGPEEGQQSPAAVPAGTPSGEAAGAGERRAADGDADPAAAQDESAGRPILNGEAEGRAPGGAGVVREASPSTASAQARPGSSIAWMGVILALLALVAAVTQPFWAPAFLGEPRSADLADRIGALEAGEGLAREAETLANLNEQVATLEQQVQQIAGRSGASGALADRIGALEQELREAPPVGPRLDDLSARLGRLEAAADVPPPGLAALTERVDGLARRIETLEADRASAAGLASRLQALESAQATVAGLAERIEAVESGQAETARRLDGVLQDVERGRSADTRSQALVVAVAQLRDAVAGGRPFAETLAATSAAAAGDPELAQPIAALQPAAAEGIPTLTSLRLSFPETARRIRASQEVAAGGDWLDQVRNTVEGLVTIRRAPGEVEGDDLDAALARAEGRLNFGDLAGAVASLESLEGAAGEAASPWLRDARTRLAAEEALRRLGDLVIARLAGGSSPEAAPGVAGPAALPGEEGGDR